METGVLPTAGWVLLGWLALAMLVTLVLSAFFAGARRAERALPATEEGVREWIRVGRHAVTRRRRHHRAHPPAA